MVLKFDLKMLFGRKKICFFAGLDNQPSGWYEGEASLQVPLESGWLLPGNPRSWSARGGT